LSNEDVQQLLESGPVQFVVADVGGAPEWVPEGECFHFWKDEVKAHLASEAQARLDGFSGGYCYFASQWEPLQPEAPIVVLEKHH